MVWKTLDLLPKKMISLGSKFCLGEYECINTNIHS